MTPSYACNGCGTCETRCQVGAVHVQTKNQVALVNLDRCIGCGLCVSTCPGKAITLLKKSVETIPPKTREDLYDIIMSKKKSRLGKLKLQGKMIVDTIRDKRSQHLNK